MTFHRVMRYTLAYGFLQNKHRGSSLQHGHTPIHSPPCTKLFSFHFSYHNCR